MIRILSVLLVWSTSWVLVVRAAPPTAIDFRRDIRPILADKCFACHGPDAESREADLRLDDESSARSDRDGAGAAVVPGKPAASLLMHRIESRDPDEIMPPPDSGKTLTPGEIARLRAWIAQGAPWSRHWAYVPPRETPVPQTSGDDWSENTIDRYLWARWAREKVRPVPDADKVTLVRRISFDLTGLPPSPELVDAFVNDRRPDAWARLVDRLLASDAYGERMASYWLDLVRYADTVGYHGDQEHAIAPYRDWVIDAFNADMPFDAFTRDQLAGDLVPGATLDQFIASGYNRVLQTSHEGGVQKKEYLAIYAADRMRNLSAVWMGATLGCAQCHDHKYDPYTMEDFYSMVAFFADLDEARHLGHGVDRTPTVREPEIVVLSRRDRQRAVTLRRELYRLLARHDANDKSRIDALQRELEQVESRARRTMISVSIPPRTIRYLPRGNWLDDSGPVMQPAIPRFLGTVPISGRRPTRLDLAQWLVDPHDGVGLLTARVMVNRLWYLMFGEGLARDLADFGGQGQAPDHPELLDHLAIQFVRGGWKVKPILRQLALSHVYRLQSRPTPELLERDPDNRLFARQTSYRLPAEMIRDQVLFASGLLVREVGGPTSHPYQPAGYYRHLNFPKRKYHPDQNENQWRRGVYVHWQRQFLHPMLKAFDAPSREECTARRPRSNTPLAALVLLNDPSMVEAARVLAARVLATPSIDDRRRIDAAFRLVVSRPADEREAAVLLKLLKASRREFADDPVAANKLISVGLARATPADVTPAEWAAWTEVARALFNLGAAVTRY